MVDRSLFPWLQISCINSQLRGVTNSSFCPFIRVVSNIERFYWFYIKSFGLLSLYYSLFLISWLKLISTSIRLFLCSWVTLPQIKMYQYRQRLDFSNMKYLLGLLLCQICPTSFSWGLIMCQLLLNFHSYFRISTWKYSSVLGSNSKISL